MPEALVTRAEWISAPVVNCQHETTCRIRFNTSTTTDGRRALNSTLRFGMHNE